MQTSGIFVKQNTENTKRHIVNIQWLIDDETKKKYYDDLGIIGEISPEPKKSQNILRLAPVELNRNSTRSRNCKVSIPDVRKVRERMRKNYRKTSEPVYKGKKLFSDPVVKVYPDYTSNLPFEILLNIFSHCDTASKIYCSRVCRRWYAIILDKMLWKNIDLSGKRLPIYDLKAILEKDVKVLCLKGSTIASNDLLIDSNRQVPISDEISYKIHSLDFTNAIISSKHLTSILSKCRNLINISLEGLIVNDDILRHLSTCSNFTCINLSMCTDINVEGLANVLQNNQNLKELNLAWINSGTLDPDKIIKSLPFGLLKINLSGFYDTLYDYHVLKMLKNCQKLEELDISDSNQLTDGTVENIICFLSNSIKEVSMSRCYGVNPNAYLAFSSLPAMSHLNIFGVMDYESVELLSLSIPCIAVNKHIYSKIARPSPTLPYKTTGNCIWSFPVA